ncbi:hypothetical protein OJ997_05870 [Solirubrobacter phytolaccae]|uniref:Uncharacterized protein n=1 Tax=Solirubrobacter phytolaccae TaxID=1404360 RepID=A0A9X3N4Z7_9ACTN|nr:hypothetical protein [Solirubrobacter phytolaccae]MDA0179813.1 hypothetical protein [Solirubrobacter phytolaccae]
MTRQGVIYLLVGLLITGVSFLGVLYQVNEAMAEDADGSVPQLICPLH